MSSSKSAYGYIQRKEEDITGQNEFGQKPEDDGRKVEVSILLQMRAKQLEGHPHHH